MPFAYKVAGIHTRYKVIHTMLAGESLRNFFSKLFKKIDYCQSSDELKMIKIELVQCEKEFCTEENLKSNYGLSHGVSKDLCQYIQALSDTVGQLEQISSRHCHNKHNAIDSDFIQSRQSLINYDNSVQKYQQIGVRLNDVFTKL